MQNLFNSWCWRKDVSSSSQITVHFLERLFLLRNSPCVWFRGVDCQEEVFANVIWPQTLNFAVWSLWSLWSLLVSNGLPACMVSADLSDLRCKVSLCLLVFLVSLVSAALLGLSGLCMSLCMVEWSSWYCWLEHTPHGTNWWQLSCLPHSQAPLVPCPLVCRVVAWQCRALYEAAPHIQHRNSCVLSLSVYPFLSPFIHDYTNTCTIVSKMLMCIWTVRTF